MDLTRTMNKFVLTKMPNCFDNSLKGNQAMKRILTICIIVTSITVMHSQDSTALLNLNSSLSLYLDCATCDVDYLSENLQLVNFVTQPSSADVHVMVNELTSGNGATSANIILVGQKRFSKLRDTVSFSLPADISPDEKRNMQLDKITLGLVPFIMKTTSANRLLLLVGDVTEVEEYIEKDPWKEWAFELNGMGSMYNQKSYNYININAGLNITKINEQFKLESYNRLDYNESKLSYYDYDSSLYKLNIYQKGFFSNSLVVKSLGDHFGIGGMAILKNDEPNNMDLRLQLGPAIEYNVFAYSEATQKQFRFLYSALYENTSYIDTTIFNRMHDEVWKHNLRILARFNNKWGFVDASVMGSNYLHDFSRYSLGASVMANIRVYKSLSVNFMCGMSMYRDRINQAKGYASLDEILTRQREMETDYQYNFSFGITYRFGSTKFPDVNPRFTYY